MNSLPLISVIELKNPLRIISTHKATREEIVEWINQAPNLQNRQQRKQLMHVFMYSSGPQTFLEALKIKHE